MFHTHTGMCFCFLIQVHTKSLSCLLHLRYVAAAALGIPIKFIQAIDGHAATRPPTLAAPPAPLRPS